MQGTVFLWQRLYVQGVGTTLWNVLLLLIIAKYLVKKSTTWPPSWEYSQRWILCFTFLRAKSFSPACGFIPSAIHTGYSPFIHGEVHFSFFKIQSLWLSYYQLDTYFVNFMLVFALTKNHTELEKILLLTFKAKFKNATFTTAPFQDVCLGIPTW